MIITSKSIHMNCACSAKVTHFLRKSVFSWNDVESSAKYSKKYTANHFWQIFSFMTHFTINQTFTSNGRPFCPNWFIWIAPALPGWCFFREQFFYFEWSVIGWKKPENVHPESFATNFQFCFFHSFHNSSNFYC